MTLSDELPDKICNECALHLNVAYNLKKKIINSEKTVLDWMMEDPERDVKARALQALQEPAHMNGDANAAEQNDEAQVEAEQKVIPEQILPPTTTTTAAQNLPDIKFSQGNVIAFFNSDEMIELSDTDSEGTVSNLSDDDHNPSLLLSPLANGRRPIDHSQGGIGMNNINGYEYMGNQFNSRECPCCDEVMSTDMNFYEHIRTHEIKQCKQCGRICAAVSNILCHFRAHFKDMTEPIKCPHCQYATTTKSSLTTHIKRNHHHLMNVPTVSHSQPFTQSFTQPPVQHQLRIEPNGPVAYKCKRCSQYFTTLDRLRAHLLSAYNIVVGREQYVLNYAIEVHQKQGNTCPICDRYLSNASSLRVHMRLHEKDRLNYCYICKTSYRHLQSMYNHFRQQHPGQNPYQCKGHCKQTFETIRNFDRHMQDVKSGIEPRVEPTRRSAVPSHGDGVASNEQVNVFDCYVCDHQVVGESMLQIHLKSHPNFICKKCGEKYAKWRSLESHYLQFHPGGKWLGYFECHNCQRQFLKLKSIHNHLRFCGRHNVANTTAP